MPIPPVKPTIVFDLDGTLIDTAPDLIDALNIVFGRQGVPPLPYQIARSLIGGGVKGMIVRGLAAAGRVVSGAELDILLKEFITHYSAHIADRSRPFPGCEQALAHLAAQNFPLAVCTNKIEALSVKLLDALDLVSRFAAICGQGTFDVMKPDPKMLQQTIVQAGGDPRHAVMVGDSITDIRTARAAGIPMIAVDFGYTDVPVRELDPDHVVGHFDELPLALMELLAAK